ncbi:EI24 domain-containing protein [Pseudothauera nasutitermitis]|uniref:EI24 domain-containing protein n=1 Tax=Pseudothauera nasutitermitis TaxID=2565930 RepID=A0A4S4AUK7_9RHOO|nr:EI24 domain-containing protein [Pseudothauera nasutitermitis]THF63616.1 EI24 domain-containing protein [Pseudothauera nasutitermitis]
MQSIFVSLARALRSLGQRGILWQLIWPGLAAAVLWVVVAVFSWATLVEALVNWVRGWAWVGPWVSESEAAGGALLVLAKIAVFLLFVPLIYLTAALLVAVVALPVMLEKVARRDYADLEERRGGTTLGSAWNSVLAGLLFVLGLLLSLPFWLIPGVGLVVSVGLTAWLNQKAFGYDALMLHADREELAALRSVRRPQMLLLGGIGALLAYVPFVNFVAPAFCGLAFVHYMLEALRRERAERGVSVLDPLPEASSEKTGWPSVR